MLVNLDIFWNGRLAPLFWKVVREGAPGRVASEIVEVQVLSMVFDDKGKAIGAKARVRMISLILTEVFVYFHFAN